MNPQLFSISAAGWDVGIAAEVGGAIAWAEHDGRPVLRGTRTPEHALECGSFPLVPYCNRIRDGSFIFRGTKVVVAPNMPGDPSPLHGSGWLSRWAVVRRTEASAELAYLHEPDEWPWRFVARQTFRVTEAGLHVELSCRNMSDDSMPCGLGHHPYFPCGPETRIDTRVDTVWTIDDDVLPVDRIPATGRYALADEPACGRGLDNGYGGWAGTTRLSTPGLPTTLMSSPDARFFQLYSPEGGSLVVAEPVSHANAALNAPEARWSELGLRVLGPGQAMTLRMDLALSAD